MHVCALNEQNGLAFLKKYFSCISVEDVAASFKPTSPERRKMMLKHPVGSPRKHPLESNGEELANNRELDIIQAAPVRDEEPSLCKRSNPSPRTTTSTPLQSLPLTNGTASCGYGPTVFFCANSRARRCSN